MKLLNVLPILWIFVVIAGFVGWVMNLLAAVGAIVHSAPVTTTIIGRLVGIFAFPLGAILGYF